MSLGGDVELGISVFRSLVLMVATVGHSNLPRHDAVPNDDDHELVVDQDATDCVPIVPGCWARRRGGKATHRLQCERFPDDAAPASRTGCKDGRTV